MQRALDPFRFLAGVLAGWANQQNSTPWSICGRRTACCANSFRVDGFAIPMTQRRRLAEKAKTLGRKALENVTTLVRPETRWPGIAS